LPALAAGLSAALGTPVEVTSRLENVQASTFPSEIITYQVRGEEHRTFAKYDDASIGDTYGHRGGVADEAAVYRDLLAPARVAAPAYVGTYIEPIKRETWLFLEYLSGSVRVNKHRQRRAITWAARWLGVLHRTFDSAATPGLNVYETAYYVGWAQRTIEHAGDWRTRFPWIDTLGERFVDVAHYLAKLPATVIHGELYPCNVLLCGDAVYGVDWESAALGPGEIDLASLTERWPADLVQDCEREYCISRWPAAGRPADFGRRMAAARMYWGFRWLGWYADCTISEKNGVRFQQLHEAALELGLLAGLRRETSWAV
jgi:hypothetical protein